MNIIRRLFDSTAAPLLAVVCVVLFAAESRRPLRRRTQPRGRRIVTNAVSAIPSFSLLRFLLLPVMVKLAIKSNETRIGISHRTNLSPAAKTVLTFLLLDYTNYLWHVLMHKLPLMWRFHVVHHSDPDLDLTTAFRFHFGELIGSVFYRGAAVFLIGASPVNVLVYEAIFEGATQFHHTNWKLPFPVEKALGKIIVTPRMHGIHHSIVKQETDSNYAVIFSLWDRLHNTLRLNVPQNIVVTGMPAYSDPGELTAAYLLKMPFTSIRPWPSTTKARDVRGPLPGKSTLAE